LSKYGLLYNTTHHVLLCPSLTCGVILHPQRIREHIVKFHKEYGPPSKDLNSEICGEFPEMTYHPIHPTTSIPVIFGLRPPTTTMSLICPICHHGYSSKSFSNENHGGKCDGAQINKQSIPRSIVQRFSKDNQHAWFAVHIPPMEHDRVQQPKNRFELYCQQQPITYQNDGQAPIIPENYRNLEQFIRRDNWSMLFESMELSVLLELTATPKEEEGFKDLQRQVHVFLDHYQAILRNGISYGTRRDIGMRPRYVI
jgi:hypothetical protein